MKIKSIVIFASLLIIVEIIICIVLLCSVEISPLDIVEVNDIAYTCANQMHTANKNTAHVLDMPTFNYDYMVFNTSERLIYSSNPKHTYSFSSAIKQRDTIVDLNLAESNYGKLVIVNDYIEKSTKLKTNLFFLVLGSCVLILLFAVIYVTYIQKVMFKPFKTLKNFAVRVAGGNLDIPLMMDKNNIFGAFTESFDLMRDELKRAKEQELLADKSKKELVAQLSHDIKTPIASIRAIAEVMSISSTNINEKEMEQLKVIESKSDQIDSLISNLFNATLEELQELKVNSIQQSSRNIISLILQADYMKKVIIDEANFPECLVWFDSLRLQQVFDNILNNSYKYANTSINVFCTIEKNQFIISIQDYGNGIPPDELPLVFNKFYRCKNADNNSGAGLGLYISRYLIEKMGGNISCENNPSGLCTYVCLQI